MSALILAVDDDESNLELLRDFCESSGWKIVTEKSGASGLDRARALEPDIILLDMVMPDTGGLELMASLQKDPKLQKVPVVVVTAVADPQVEEQAFRLGAIDYVRKPFRLADLQSRISTALEITSFVSDAKAGKSDPEAVQRAVAELLGRSRAGERFGCSLVSIDGFAELRSTERDRAALLLWEILRRLRACIRGRDALYLTAQAEPVLLFPASDRDGVRVALDRLSRSIKSVTIAGKPTAVVLRFGFVTVPNAKIGQTPDVIEQARAAATAAREQNLSILEAGEPTA